MISLILFMELSFMRRSTATTDYLKECMGTALLELMREKPLEKISIEEMTAKADVGRSTYFRYFKSKDEVLSFKIRCLWKRYDEAHGLSAGGGDGPAMMSQILRFCLETRDINDLLYSTGHQNCILDAYLQILSPAEAEDDDVLAYYSSNFAAYALFGIVNAWILRGYKETPEEMERIMRQSLGGTEDAVKENAQNRPLS